MLLERHYNSWISRSFHTQQTSIHCFVTLHDQSGSDTWGAFSKHHRYLSHGETLNHFHSVPINGRSVSIQTMSIHGRSVTTRLPHFRGTRNTYPFDFSSRLRTLIFSIKNDIQSFDVPFLIDSSLHTHKFVCLLTHFFHAKNLKLHSFKGASEMWRTIMGKWLSINL